MEFLDQWLLAGGGHGNLCIDRAFDNRSGCTDFSDLLAIWTENRGAADVPRVRAAGSVRKNDLHPHDDREAESLSPGPRDRSLGAPKALPHYHEESMNTCAECLLMPHDWIVRDVMQASCSTLADWYGVTLPVMKLRLKRARLEQQIELPF